MWSATGDREVGREAEPCMHYGAEREKTRGIACIFKKCRRMQEIACKVAQRELREQHAAVT